MKGLRDQLSALDKEQETLVAEKALGEYAECRLPERAGKPRLVAYGDRVDNVCFELAGWTPPARDEVLTVASHFGRYLERFSPQSVHPTPHDTSLNTVTEYQAGYHKFDLRDQDPTSRFSYRQFAEVESEVLGQTPIIRIRPISIAPIDVRSKLEEYVKVLEKGNDPCAIELP